MTTASGPGVQRLGVAVNVWTSFNIEVRDALGNVFTQNMDPYEFDVIFTTPGENSVLQHDIYQDEFTRFMVVHYSPVDIGIHEISVIYKKYGSHIRGSPFTVDVGGLLFIVSQP